MNDQFPLPEIPSGLWARVLTAAVAAPVDDVPDWPDGWPPVDPTLAHSAAAPSPARGYLAARGACDLARATEVTGAEDGPCAYRRCGPHDSGTACGRIVDLSRYHGARCSLLSEQVKTERTASGQGRRGRR